MVIRWGTGYISYDKYVHTMGHHASVNNDYVNAYVSTIETARDATEGRNQSPNPLNCCHISCLPP